MTGDNNKKERRRKRRWGDASNTTATDGGGGDGSGIGAASTGTSSKNVTTSTSKSIPMDSKAKALALQESVRARLAALKAKKAQGGSIAASSNNGAAPLPTAASTSSTTTDNQRPAKKAKHYELDMSVTGPTYRSELSSSSSKSRQQQAKKKVNPYLAHRETEEEVSQQTKKQKENDEPYAEAMDATDVSAKDGVAPGAVYESNVDARLEENVLAQSLDRRRRGRKQLSFVEPGTFVKIAERKRQKAANAAEAGFISGRKTGQYVQSTTIMANIYGKSSEERLIDDENERLVDPNKLPPRAEAGVSSLGNLSADPVDEKPGADRKANKVPLVVEWWDMELLPSKLKKQVAAYEGKALSAETQSQMKLLKPSIKSNKDETKDEDTEKSMKSTTAAAASLEGGGDDAHSLNDPMTSPQAIDLREKCSKLASLSYSKTAGLIQHIVPIKPANAAVPREDVQPVLHLTKKELKRQRKLRRQEKQREMQDLQAAGLIPPPEPRLTLKNFIRVLGDQAYVDPSQMEQKVMEQVQARQKAHLERNEARKLTKEQRREKRAKKLQEDTSSTGIHVALFYVKDISHPYHRAKVDLNAQQYNLSGGVVECVNPQLSCVIVEGGPKAVEKYTRLMLVRMKWTGTGDEDDDDEEEADEDQGQEDQMMLGEDGTVIQKKKKNKFNNDNKCELVWTGIATKRFFKGFVFQACETSDEASKILRAKGVGHFWEQLLTHATGSGETFHLKLADDSDDEDDDDDDDEEEQDKMQIDG